ncbi:fibrobacter succinogenes major paralogous domain-containing protein [soil metagenome]
MKQYMITWVCLITLLAGSMHGGESALTDYKGEPRDTVRIGNQVWMAKNLSIPAPNSFWYERDSVGNVENGQLYFFSGALMACPKGWHLPSDEEWQQMVDFLGGKVDAKDKLMKGGSSGLNLTYAGYRSSNSSNDLFGRKGQTGFYWTSTVKAEQTAYARTVSSDSLHVSSNFYRRANAFSVRFVKD